MKRYTVIACLLATLGAATSLSADETQPSKELFKVLRYYTGNWSVTGSLGDAAIKGKASFRMPAGKHCIIGTVSFEAQGKPMHISLVSGWDSSTGWYTEQGVVSDGTVYVMKWRKVSPHEDAGELVGTFNGKNVTEKDKLVRKSDADFVVTCTNRTEGDKRLPDMTLVYKRLPREKAKRKAAKSGN